MVLVTDQITTTTMTTKIVRPKEFSSTITELLEGHQPYNKVITTTTTVVLVIIILIITVAMLIMKIYMNLLNHIMLSPLHKYRRHQLIIIITTTMLNRTILWHTAMNCMTAQRTTSRANSNNDNKTRT